MLSDLTTPSRTIAAVGNPNSGKTTLFNTLTGMRQKIANYPGVTVERIEGRLSFPDGTSAVLIDLPGTYSLNPRSPDEHIVVDILLKRSTDSIPDLILCVVDATNLTRNLYLVSQVLDQRLPVVVALTMVDLARKQGLGLDIAGLEEELGVPVIPVVASTGEGLEELVVSLRNTHTPSQKSRTWSLPKPIHHEHEELVDILRGENMSEPAAFHEAIGLLAAEDMGNGATHRFSKNVLDHVRKDHEKLDFLGFDRQTVFVEARYAWITRVCSNVTKKSTSFQNPIGTLDRFLAHKVWGLVFFLAIMALLFYSVFTWATIPMDLIGNGFDWLGVQVTTFLPEGELRDLVVNGAIAGVAAVVTFVPQIFLLSLCLCLLEDTGYMARAAFMMDKLLHGVGLHGKSFVPLLSSFACAIPGIMATRTIESPRDRLVTILVAPLMGCSARLPVYTLLIAGFIPATLLWGFLPLPAVVLLSLYVLGVVAAMAVAAVFRKTFLSDIPSSFVLELPPYRMPSLRTVLINVLERCWLFLKRAGTFILGVSIILWFLASYPKLEHATPAEQLKQSFAGRAGQVIEPLIRPLGFDWKIGIGLISSILQREVFVSTMGTVYNLQKEDSNEGSVSLREHLQHDRNESTGKPTFTMLTAICLMVYYALAMQCLSTVAVVRRETNGWKWPLFQIGYMTVLAYTVTFAVYRFGLFMGLDG